MKKLLSVFLIMFMVSSGIGYASDYGLNDTKNAVEIFELQGHNYIVFVVMLAGLIPLAFPLGFFFLESGNFWVLPLGFFGDYAGSYTQTEATFIAHCDYGESLNIPSAFDFEGTISGIFIYGKLTGQAGIGDRIVIPANGFFFGFPIPSMVDMK